MAAPTGRPKAYLTHNGFMSADIILCHGREYVNTDDGLLLVHDFPNPFQPNEALPAVNWKGSWVIISTPVMSAPLYVPTHAENATNGQSSIPNSPRSVSSSSSSSSCSTSLPSPEEPEPSLVPSALPPNSNEIPPDEPTPVTFVIPTETPPERKPIVPSRPVASPPPQPRPHTTHSHRYESVSAMSAMPRWSENPNPNYTGHSHSMPMHPDSERRESLYGARNMRHNDMHRDRRSQGRFETRNGSSTNHDFAPPPAKRHARHPIDSSPDHRSRYPGEGYRHHEGHYRREQQNSSFHRSSSPAAQPHSALYNPLEPLDMPTREEAQAAPSAPAMPEIIFPEFPRELVDRSELERIVASNSGPANIGPTLVITVKREGSRGILPVEVALSASVSGLKLKLRALTGLKVHEQRLMLGKLILHPDIKISSLKEEIQAGKHILLCKRTDHWKIDVVTIDGRTVSIELGPKDYVADLEDAVDERLLDGKNRKFHLLNGGHRLRRPNTLLEAGIKNGHCIRLVLSSVQA